MRPAATIAAAALLTACAGDNRTAERVVRSYNEAAIAAYRSRDFALLHQVATKPEWDRVVVLVDLKSAADLVLESELQHLEVTRVERNNERMLTAWTAERWRYWDRPLKPGAAPGTTYLVDMTLSYELVDEDGSWKVDRVRALSSDYLEPKGFKYVAPPPSHGGTADAGARLDDQRRP